MKIQLTDFGKRHIEEWLLECEKQKADILLANKDVCAETILPTMEDIISDMENGIGLDDYGDYHNGWGITDNYVKLILLEWDFDFAIQD